MLPPIDKANGNVAFICQRFYAIVLIEELGLDHDNTATNKTYILAPKTNDPAVSGYTTSLFDS